MQVSGTHPKITIGAVIFRSGSAPGEVFDLDLPLNHERRAIKALLRP